MSFKNRLKYELVGKLTHQPGIYRLLKRLLIITVVVGTIFIITTSLLVGYGLSQINKRVVNRPDAELVALNNLLSTKQIVLTEQQKTDILPLVNLLAKEQDNTQQVQKIKAQILSNLDKRQLNSIQTWQQNMTTETKGILNIGRQALAQKISNYTGIAADDSQRLLDSISAWLNLNPVTDNVTTNLQKQIEKSP